MAKAAVVDNNNDLVHEPRVLEIMQTEISQCTKHDIEGELLSLEAQFPDHDKQHQQIANIDNPLLAFKATSDPDTMYLHEAMREKD